MKPFSENKLSKMYEFGIPQKVKDKKATFECVKDELCRRNKSVLLKGEACSCGALYGEYKDVKKGLVSVITPCYNAEKYISETIESVRNQSYTDWKMIIE